MPDERSLTNVIWVFGDQHRAQALGMAGDPNMHTPNIDVLSAEGVTFTGAVAGFPLCCPFRGSLLTSRYPHKCVPGHECPLPEGSRTLAHVFRENGYDTAYFGKWHLDGWHESEGRAAFHIVPPERRGGFDTWVGYENNNAQWDSWVHGGEGETAFHRRLEGYETDCLTDMLISHLEKRAEDGKPFFAALSVQPPHNPYVADERWMARHTPGGITLRPNVPDVPWVAGRARRELAGYYAQIENLDWNLGRIREALDRTGLAWNTHIIFFSDHGDMHGSHGQFLKTGPYEEALRIPFVIGGRMSYGPVRGRSVSAPVNHVDIAPTTLGLCGIEPPEWMEGTDYSGLRDRSRPDQKAPGEYPDSAYIQSVVPTGHGDSVDRPWRGIVTRDGWKYVCLEGQPWLMFDLNTDPYEQANLAHNTRFGEKRRGLQAILARWIDLTDDAFGLPSIG